MTLAFVEKRAIPLGQWSNTDENCVRGKLLKMEEFLENTNPIFKGGKLVEYQLRSNIGFSLNKDQVSLPNQTLLDRNTILIYNRNEIARKYFCLRFGTH